ncbi:MAG: hypothetical protein HYT14_00440 [Candidatus Liptonbacteria bacterium]|nr:hypothetical protein [Candidatus Liptonbacteria bacterium]
MTRYRSAMAIIGPTTSGKTAVAYELARRIGGGEVVNLDKIACFKNFPLSSGVSDALEEKGVKRHLYEILEPDQEVIPAETYIGMVRSECAQIIAGGGLPIIEGGSTTYVPALFEANEQVPFCAPIIGLRPPAEFDIREKIARRVVAAIESGLVDEVREGLKKYRSSFVMNDTYAIIPIVRYLDGRIGLDAAREEIVDRFTNYAHRQMEFFGRFPGIVWLEHKPSELTETVAKIAALLKA